MDREFLSTPIDFEGLQSFVDRLCERFPSIAVTSIGKSLLGRDIPLITVGRGHKTYVFVGAVHAMEWHTALLLLQFAEELAAWERDDRFGYGMDPRFVLSGRRICIIPMLNPDGVELVNRGVDRAGVMRERLLKMNGSQDFSHWQANARGVDLNHNFNAGFEEYRRLIAGSDQALPGPARHPGPHPESEPESQAICGFLRSVGAVRLLLCLHTQGEEIYWDFNGYAPRPQLRVAQLLARYSGYTVARPEGTASYSGLKDWFLLELGPLAFTIECGRGTNPLPASDTPFIYARLRKMLFRSLLI